MPRNPKLALCGIQPYRKNDDLNGLRWAFGGMKTQVKRVSDDGLLSIFFDAKFGEGADECVARGGPKFME
jgi:hypothetical protein